MATLDKKQEIWDAIVELQNRNVELGYQYEALTKNHKYWRKVDCSIDLFIAWKVNHAKMRQILNSSKRNAEGHAMPGVLENELKPLATVDKYKL